jgi:hypothetical protein
MKKECCVLMKKRLFACVAVLMLMLSFAAPAMAAEVMSVEPVNVAVEMEQQIAPRTEITQTVWRIYHGQLQFRVWGTVSGTWLTDWTTF